MGGSKALYDCVKAFSETDFTEDLKAIDVPVLILHGDDDQVVPIADSALLSAKLRENGHAEGVSGSAPRHVHHASRGHQSRPARVHQGPVALGFSAGARDGLNLEMASPAFPPWY